MDDDISIGLDGLFSLRNTFIIVGLTGRTGSGCSEVADILASDRVGIEERMKKPVNGRNITNEDRKYKVIYNYTIANWKAFINIRVKDIITSFLLEHPAEHLIEHFQLDKSKMAGILDIYNDMHKQFTAEGKPYHLPKDLEYERSAIVDVNDFYFNRLPNFADKIKTYFEKKYSNEYINLYQRIGDNIRLSGSAIGELPDTKKLFTISERINRLIKYTKKYNALIRSGEISISDSEYSDQVADYFVIDAIRNPFEAMFFKARYSAFYLMAINTPSKDRIRRLTERNLTKTQIIDLDEKEYPKKYDPYSGTKELVSQNIQGCLEKSDIYIANPDEVSTLHRHDLIAQLVRYISLVMHPGLITPSKHERCMNVAYTAKFNSGCISRQVGAAITNQDYSIKAIGWNDVPDGQVSCNLRSATELLSGEDEHAYSEYEKTHEEFRNTLHDKLVGHTSGFGRGLNPAFCFKSIKNIIDKNKNQVHTRALHAEENAFLQIAKYGGTGIFEGVLYTTASPCELCSKKAFQLGIKKIYYVDPYPGISESHILGYEVGRPILELFSGAVGRAYHQLYEPLLPYKDELETRGLV
jgi:deoxycytidylate deaminase/dephospho-CoA kinase